MTATHQTAPAHPFPDLRRLHILDAGIGEAIKGNRSQEAVRIASEHAAAALNGLATARTAEGSGEEGIRLFREALRLCPGSQSVFHNLTAVLLAQRSLRGEELTAVQNHLLSRSPGESWTRAYRRLLFLPNFLNLEFVSGWCNLQCRRCLGGNGDKTGLTGSYISAEDFRRTLEAAPTIQSLTLSSGDSEPLLHPEFEQILDIAHQHGVALDVFTNGLPLTARVCHKIVMSKTIGMVNFSLDATTEETYRRIRGAELGRVFKKIEMLRQMKEQTHSESPRISLSFVAMTDNISELTDFVDLAGRIGASRVYIEDLIGWDGDGGPNRPATENPACTSFVEEASRSGGTQPRSAQTIVAQTDQHAQWREFNAGHPYCGRPGGASGPAPPTCAAAGGSTACGCSRMGRWTPVACCMTSPTWATSATVRSWATTSSHVQPQLAEERTATSAPRSRSAVSGFNTDLPADTIADPPARYPPQIA